MTDQPTTADWQTRARDAYAKVEEARRETFRLHRRQDWDGKMEILVNRLTVCAQLTADEIADAEILNPPDFADETALYNSVERPRVRLGPITFLLQNQGPPYQAEGLYGYRDCVRCGALASDDGGNFIRLLADVGQLLAAIDPLCYDCRSGTHEPALDGPQDEE